MAKTLNTRIQHKIDTTANWEAVEATFIPLKGELIIFDDNDGEAPKIKIGDGATNLANLPFAGGGAGGAGSNITYGTTDLTAGESPLAEGAIYFVYE